MGLTVNRRSFSKTIGTLLAAPLVPSLLTGCKQETNPTTTKKVIDLTNLQCSEQTALFLRPLRTMYLELHAILNEKGEHISDSDLLRYKAIKQQLKEIDDLLTDGKHQINRENLWRESGNEAVYELFKLLGRDYAEASMELYLPFDKSGIGRMTGYGGNYNFRIYNTEIPKSLRETFFDGAEEVLRNTPKIHMPHRLSDFIRFVNQNLTFALGSANREELHIALKTNSNGNLEIALRAFFPNEKDQMPELHWADLLETLPIWIRGIQDFGYTLPEELIAEISITLVLLANFDNPYYSSGRSQAQKFFEAIEKKEIPDIFKKTVLIAERALKEAGYLQSPKGYEISMVNLMKKAREFVVKVYPER